MKIREYLANAQRLYDNGNISAEVYDAMLMNVGNFCAPDHEYAGYADVYKLINNKWEKCPNHITIEEDAPERIISKIEAYIKTIDAPDVFVELTIEEDGEYYNTYTFLRSKGG